MASFQKRSGSIRVLITKGIYRSKPLTQTFDTMREAKAWANKIEADMDSNQHQQRSEHTLREAIIKYRDEYASTGDEGSEVSRLNKFLTTLKFIDKKITDVEQADIVQWRNLRLQDKRLKNKKENLYVTISQATVRREYNLLRSVFTAARKEWHWIKFNPCDDVDRPADSPPRHKRVRDDVIQRFIDYFGYDDEGLIETNQQQVAAAILFGIETTMRRSEICRIEKQFTNFEEHYTFLKTTKNGQPKFIPLSTLAEDILRRLPNEDSPTFFTIRPRYISDEVKKAKNKLGIDDVRFHDTRHEGTTRLAKVFNNPGDLAKITGHRDINTLIKVYYNPDVQDLAQAIRDAEKK